MPPVGTENTLQWLAHIPKITRTEAPWLSQKPHDIPRIPEATLNSLRCCPEVAANRNPNVS